MKIYLMRHAEAVATFVEDATRPLTSHGREQALQAAQALREKNLSIACIYHSPLVRAQETAAIVGVELGVSAVMEKAGLLPGDAVASLASECVQPEYADCLFVSHLPLLDYLASQLALDDAFASLCHFTPAAVACLEQHEDGWRLAWLMTVA